MNLLRNKKKGKLSIFCCSTRGMYCLILTIFLFEIMGGGDFFGNVPKRASACRRAQNYKFDIFLYSANFYLTRDTHLQFDKIHLFLNPSIFWPPSYNIWVILKFSNCVDVGMVGYKFVLSIVKIGWNLWSWKLLEWRPNEQTYKLRKI